MRDKNLCITCKYGSRFLGDTSTRTRNPENVACIYAATSGRGTATKKDGTDLRGESDCALYEKVEKKRKREWRWL